MSRLSSWTSRNKSRPRIASSSSAEMLSIKSRMFRSLLLSRWIRVFRAPILSDNQRRVVVFIRLDQNSRIGQVCFFKRSAMFAKNLRDFLVNPKEQWYQVLMGGIFTALYVRLSDFFLISSGSPIYDTLSLIGQNIIGLWIFFILNIWRISPKDYF